MILRRHDAILRRHRSDGDVVFQARDTARRPGGVRGREMRLREARRGGGGESRGTRAELLLEIAPRRSSG